MIVLGIISFCSRQVFSSETRAKASLIGTLLEVRGGPIVIRAARV